MRISVLVSIAIALTVVAGQAAMADPEARNHGNKPSDNPLSDVAKLRRKYLADGVFTGAERKDLEKQIKDRQDLRQQLDQRR
jgi:hypothetical protein